MKRMIALMLAMTLLLCGCGGSKKVQQKPADIAPLVTEAPVVLPTEATTEPTTEPTTVPTEPPVYRNPVNGELLDGPFTDRIFATTISNLQENMPHVGLVNADIVMEMYVNMNNVVRCLALFSDIESVDAIGSTRSTRPIFNDIAQHYDLVLAHAGGSSTALEDAARRGVPNFNIEAWETMKVVETSYRDTQYRRTYENSLFGIGSGIHDYAEQSGIPMSLEKDYGFRFTEDGVPADGEDAQEITIHMNYKQAKKNTIMKFDAELGKYVWNQYNKVMQDQITGETEAFDNVLILFAEVSNEGIYHYANFTNGGTGYYANGGKIIPIYWDCAGDKDPFVFSTQNDEPLEIGVGKTYIAIVSDTDSSVEY